MPARKVSVLAVDDDIHVLRLIHSILEVRGYQVIVAVDGETALEKFYEHIPDIVLLDIMMPGVDGLDMCRRIREFSDVPIIMVTAKGNKEDTVAALDAGADDYMAKPFSNDELIARIKAVLRRTKSRTKNQELVFRSGGLTIDFARYKVSLNGQDVHLTATEYALLAYLARNSGSIVPSQQILENVWGEEYTGEIHILQVTIGRLRRKLQENARNPEYILTKSGIGYMIRGKNIAG